ncbi:MBL fold metallo-hydrolase [Synechococcus sp. RedBA-s]|uniref:MBL fold metallo-hydrolase n=1 Tax=Synechococcus sp. RedBA-s TaxID=2823741 RepID=UPI0020CF83F5|nr:MBL fold metallo-hydrolase [Synechococcus sp. RedBA-s]MCP9799683.1 MBL fold metallo-hydrolase [Synechococcus sp. RedBA-s]
MAVAPASSFSLAAAAGGNTLLFRQLFDADTGTFTYLIAEVTSGQALLVDSVFEQHDRDLALVQELGLQLVACLDTHAHADHVTGSWLMHAATGSSIALAAGVGAENVTLPLRQGDRVAFGGRALEVRATPGHTNGCLTFVLDDHSLAFTGDALLVRGCGRCDFQQGNAHTLFRSITGQILSLPESCLLYPGHDYTGRSVTSVTEEKAYNARLGGEADERDFVGYMENLELPHPRRLAEALPANLRSGRPLTSTPDPDDWAPIQRSYAGLPQLGPRWVQEHHNVLCLVDVRSAEEFNGPDGRISGSLLIPLPELERRLGEIPAERPVVVLCHSGSRSALATQELIKAGRPQVANLRGGLRAWQREGLPLEHNSPNPS